MPLPARHWKFDYLAACELNGGEVVESGDELGLYWYGPLSRPSLTRKGEGRRALVCRIGYDHNGIARHVIAALFADARDARERNPRAQPAGR